MFDNRYSFELITNSLYARMIKNTDLIFLKEKYSFDNWHLLIAYLSELIVFL